MVKGKETAQVVPAAEAKENNVRILSRVENKITYEEALAIVDAENRRRQEEREKIEAEEKRPKLFKTGKYECTERCYHGRLYEVGEIASFTADKPSPLEMGADGKMYVSHFRPIEG